jgi:hypothetical protein
MLIFELVLANPSFSLALEGVPSLAIRTPFSVPHQLSNGSGYLLQPNPNPDAINVFDLILI